MLHADSKLLSEHPLRKWCIRRDKISRGLGNGKGLNFSGPNLLPGVWPWSFHFSFALGFTFLTLVLQLYTEKLMKMCKHYSVFLPFNILIRLKISHKENRLITGKEEK